MSAPIQSAFEPVLGQPCWGVKSSFGSFLVLNFGPPRLRVHEPTPHPRTGRVRRVVALSGQHHLWIQQAAWSLVRDERTMAHCETPGGVLDPVLQDELAGQALLQLVTDAGRCDFHFDLGAVLSTWPHPGDDGPDPSGEWPTMWSLYSEPDTVLSFFGNGGTHVGTGSDARGTAPSSIGSGVRLLPE